MSNKAVVVFVLLALALGGLIMFMNWRGGPAPVGAATPAVGAAAPISAADVVAIKVKGTDGREDEVRRDGAASAAGWVLATKSASGDESTWPVDPNAPQNVIRAICDLKAGPGTEASSSATMPANAVVVSLILKDGSSRFFRISPSAVGGKTLADLDAKQAMMVDASLLTQLTTPGPRAWRINKAIPGVGAYDTSRITIASSADTLAFAKLDGRWYLSRPVNARANQQAAANMLDTIGKLTVERWVDDAERKDLAAMGLNAPRMIINTERDIRTATDATNVTSEVRKRDLFIGGPADPTGATLFASSDPAGQSLFIVNAQSIASISTAARNYLDLTATGVSPSDIGIITLKSGKLEVGYRRQNGKWVKMLAGGKTDKTEVNQQAVAEMVEFFASRPGQPEPVPMSPISSATVEAKPTKGGTTPAQPKIDEPMRTVSRVQLMSEDGAAIDTITMGYTADGVLAARNQNVMVLYPNQTAPKMLEMPEFKSLPAQPGQSKRKATKPVGSPAK